MMRWLLLLQLLAVGFPPPPPPPPIFQQAPEAKPVLPAHVRGPHEGEPGAVCYRGEDHSPGPGRMLYHCECRFLCDVGAAGEPLQREADECVTACGKEQCACHGDESCQMPMEPKR